MKTLADYDPNLVAFISSRLDNPTTPADQILDQIYDHFYQCYSDNLPATMPAELLAQIRPYFPNESAFTNTVEITAHLAYKDLHTPPPAAIISKNIPSTTDWHVVMTAINAVLAALVFYAQPTLSGLIGAFITFGLLIGGYYLTERLWKPRHTLGDTLARVGAVTLVIVVLGIFIT